ncbi:hypothetical protein BT96DRAFT_952195, partial [Gymnopus androsaceus JB14]
LTEEPDYIVTWFEWEDESRSLTPGLPLVFRLQSKVSFKDWVSFCELLVTGDIFIQDQLKNFHKVGSVDFQADDAHGNPVVSYLQRHGVVQGLTVPLANKGYTLTSMGGNIRNVVLSYNVSFVRMVLPGEEFTVNIRHLGRDCKLFRREGLGGVQWRFLKLRLPTSLTDKDRRSLYGFSIIENVKDNPLDVARLLQKIAIIVVARFAKDPDNL